MSVLRCGWCGDDPLYVAYHDDEWGVPVRDDVTLFEFLILEGAQAGLSWITILRKREGYRAAFEGFDPERVARFDQRRIDRLLTNPEIVRNRLKVASAVTNARAFLEVQDEVGSFSDYIWSFTDGRAIQNRWPSMDQIPARTPLAEEISRDLKKRGFRFVGPTIVYAHMQATGMVNDHVVDCYRYREVAEIGQRLMSRIPIDPVCLVVAFLVLLVLGAVILFQRRRLSQVGEREQKLQATLEERSQQLEKANKSLRDLADGDPLTGIANHRTFQEELKLQWRRTARSRLPMTLLMIDVDGLKHYNDNKGQQAGDECLRQIAETLRNQLQRPGDLIGRYGGDEFGVLLPETDASGGIAVAEGMRQAVEGLELAWGPDLENQRITISLGAATTVPSPQELSTSLVATADRALSVAKRNGRNRVEM